MQIQFPRPRLWTLHMELPIDFSDRLRRHPLALRQIWERGMCLLAIDGTMDDDVRHVDPVRAELARHSLRQGAQPELPNGERIEILAPAKRDRRAGEQDRATPPARASPAAPRGRS